MEISAERYKEILEDAPFGIAVLEKGKIIYHNRHLEKITGFSSEELAKLSFKELFPERELPLLTSAFNKSPSPPFPLHFTLSLLTKSKKEIETEICLLSYEKDKSILYLREIVPSKVLGKREFDILGKISHEILTPLSTIKETISILEERASEELIPFHKSLLRLAWEEALRLERIARNLIDVSRIAQGKVFLRPSEISLPDLINKSIASLHLLSQKKNLSIIPDLPINLPPIFADPDLLSSILINLLDNAIKFSPPNQKIILKASILPSGHPLISNKNLPQANFYLLISITDFGPGIDPESKEIIFQMFEKGKSAPETKGLGIGLSIVKEFVQAHKGVIWVESKKNVGSTFTFIIPFLSPPNQIENWKLNHGRKS